MLNDLDACQLKALEEIKAWKLQFRDYKALFQKSKDQSQFQSIVSTQEWSISKQMRSISTNQQQSITGVTEDGFITERTNILHSREHYGDPTRPQLEDKFPITDSYEGTIEETNDLSFREHSVERSNLQN